VYVKVRNYGWEQGRGKGDKKKQVKGGHGIGRGKIQPKPDI